MKAVMIDVYADKSVSCLTKTNEPFFKSGGNNGKN